MTVVGNLWSQVVGGIPSQSGSSVSSFLFPPCFDTLIFTICPVRPITGALHFYASAVWANSAYSCCRQTALSLPPWLTLSTKQACVRNQEFKRRANHFNKHLPTKHRLKWERAILHFIRYCPSQWSALDITKVKKTFHDSLDIESSPTPKLIWISFTHSNSDDWQRPASVVFHRRQVRNMNFTVSC